MLPTPFAAVNLAITWCLFNFQSFVRLETSSCQSWKSYAYFEIDDQYGILEYLYFFAGERKHVTYAAADNTNSQQTWEYVTDRLENCKNNHKLCHQTPGALPSRLIEIREEDGKLHFRLVLTSNSGVRGRYITLSHRWGTDATIKLTLQELNEFMDEIPSQKMPQKYIDAAVIALRLKIRYLWIDSLCIIQDSDDWDQESGKMDLVYRHGYCNLAATSAMNSSEGFFYKRSPSQICPHIIHLPKMGKALVYDTNDQTVLVKLDTEPLNLRGWVCQERLLSTRNVSFSRRLVYFECAEEISCELVDGAVAPCGLRYDPACRNLWSLTSLQNMSFDDIQTFWHKIIGFYSNSNITKPGDKLVAVSGIAKFCQQAFGSDYLAGLWISNLARDLCWHSRNNLQHVPDYRAPSWSWASVIGRVQYRPIGDYGHLVDFMDVYSTPVVRTNPFGAVQDSRIRLLGYVFPIFHKGCDSCEHQPRQMHGNQTSPFHRRISSICDSLLNGWAHFVQIDDHALGNSKSGPLEPMDCFLLPIICESEDDYCTELRLYCLILVAATPSRGVYQRIGLLDFIFNPTEEVNWAALGCPPREDPRSLKEMAECVLLILEQKFQHCKVPSYEDHTLRRHRITLI
ncbi:heterokaryon incompatibility protein-domain-containing protein [Annulohypoxylon bovei var. microspora]|nr:heterokaryon incompatibility protein-domain-containing protein [Annulohypoxylon bovei var. microspora]